MRKISLLLALLLAYFATTEIYAYPGCTEPDIIIGGQMWAGCNASQYAKGSNEKTGWFLAGDRSPLFTSYIGGGSRLAFQGKVRSQDWIWNVGPCAKGYRLPTRGEFETTIMYARYNNTSVASLLRLPLNGSYRTYRDSDGDVMVDSRIGVLGAYWTSSKEDIYGLRNIVLHIGTNYQGYRMDGTDGVYTSTKYTWQYDDAGLELVGGEISEMANVRCIRN